MQPSAKHRRTDKRKWTLRRPDGLLHSWVFELIRHWGRDNVISMEGYRQRKFKPRGFFF